MKDLFLSEFLKISAIVVDGAYVDLDAEWVKDSTVDMSAELQNWFEGLDKDDRAELVEVCLLELVGLCKDRAGVLKLENDGLVIFINEEYYEENKENFEF